MNRPRLFTKATLRRHRRQAMLTVGGGWLSPHPWAGKRRDEAVQPLPEDGTRARVAGTPAGAATTTVAPTRRQLEVGRIGDVVPRADGAAKVKGEFAYSSD